MKTKICSKCKTEYPATTEYFYRHKECKYGLAARCKKCRNKEYRKYSLTEGAKLLYKKRRKKYEKTDKGKRARSRANYRRGIREYGLTIEQYDLMLSEQNNGCAICGNSESNRRLCIDHNHITGEVRGLLCTSCNVLVGYLEKNDGLKQKARRYLKNNPQ